MSARPVYLIPGGHPLDMKSMMENFRTVFDACGEPNPKVAYIGTASHDNWPFYMLIKRQLVKAGAGEVTLVPIARKRVDVEAAKRMLSEADCIFLSGGEVEDGIVLLKKAGLDVFLTELYNDGKIFFGTSAGCIMMGRNWVHWDVEGDDSTASLFDCLNFVPMTFDTHCEDEGWKELKCALRLMGSGSRGHGLSTGGFYTADKEGDLKILRNAPVVFRNTNGKIETEEKDGPV